MNIEGAKLAAVLQNSATTEGGTPNSTDGGTLGGEFADALTGQIESLRETKTQAGWPDPLLNTAPASSSGLPARVVLADVPDNEQKPGRFSGNTPTPLTIIQEPVDANTDTALAELAEMLGYPPAGKGEKLPSVESHARKDIAEGRNNQKKDSNLVLSTTETLISMPPHSGQNPAVLPTAPEAGEESFNDPSSPRASIDSGKGRALPSSLACISVMAGEGQRPTENKKEISDSMRPMAEVVLPVNDRISEQIVPMTEVVPSSASTQGQEQILSAPKRGIEAKNLSDSGPIRRETSPDAVETAILGGRHVSTYEAKAMKSHGREPELMFEVSELADAVPSFGVYSGHPSVVNNPAHQADPQKTDSSFLKPLLAESKSNTSGSDPALAETLQEGSAFGQSAKEAQHLPSNSFEKTAQSLDSSRTESQPISSSADRPVPQGMPEMAQLNRQPVDNKVEVPALMRSLAHPEWHREFGERILWMTHKELSAAEIKLNPQHLGPISVRIEMNNDQATISFTAQHASVREAIEASLPKLREMMSHQQLNLADVNISQNPSSDHNQSQSRHASRHFNGFASINGNASDPGDEAENGRTVVGKGLLSLYA